MGGRIVDEVTKWLELASPAILNMTQFHSMSDLLDLFVYMWWHCTHKESEGAELSSVAKF